MALIKGDTLLNGQYRILRQLGRGGFGSVYLAQDTLLGEEVAIKEMIPSLVGDEAMLKRFLAEAKATMRLTHERIVRTHNVFSERGNYYIAMEYMAGGSLEERLQRRPLPVTEAVQIAADLCEGLSYAHQRGVVHCDLKPANILFTSGGRAKLADFGIAHVSESMLTRTWQTPTTFVAGTLPYMSPEQADGVRDDCRIDVYAMGAVLYRMVTGRTYLEFDQRDTPGAQADNVLRIRTEEVMAPSGCSNRIPAWLDGVILTALDKQPAKRYASAAQLRDALLRDAPAPPPGHRPTPTPPKPTSAPPPKSRPRRAGLPMVFWLAAGGAVIVVVILAVVLAIALGGDGDATPTPFVTVVVLPPDEPTPIVTSPADPSPTPAPPTEPPLPEIYLEDFSDAESGWDTYEYDTTSARIVDGEYQLSVYAENLVTWGVPNPQPPWSRYEVAVDARAVEGPANNNFGIMVGYQLEGSVYYWFQISSDGYYAVDLNKDGAFTSLVSFTASDAITQGLGATNYLEVVRDGSYFSFFVNGTHLVDVSDSTVMGGGIGLAAGAFGEPGVVVGFDEVLVLPLP